MLELEDKEYIQDTVRQDGFDTAMRYDLTMEEIEDPKFQKLRKAYIQVVGELKKYCAVPDEE